MQDQAVEEFLRFACSNLGILKEVFRNLPNRYLYGRSVYCIDVNYDVLKKYTKGNTFTLNPTLQAYLRILFGFANVSILRLILYFSQSHDRLSDSMRKFEIFEMQSFLSEILRVVKDS